MSLEVILEAKYINIFKMQFDYLLKNKDKISCVHIINSASDQALSGDIYICKIKNFDWVKLHKRQTDRIEFLNKNFNNKNINYIYFSEFVCWQTKNFIEEFHQQIKDSKEVVLPQIFNSERNVFLHQVSGYLKTFTFRPWDDEYIDTLRSETWDPLAFHYLHNNYLNLIKFNNFDKINFNKYYFNNKETKHCFLIGWNGSLEKDKKWCILGNVHSAIIAQNENVYNFLLDSNYVDKYIEYFKRQFDPIHVQLHFDLEYPDDPKELFQLSFDFNVSDKNINFVFPKHTIKFAINSHISQDVKVVDNLIYSLINLNKINPSNIIVVIGGCEESKRETKDGVIHQYVDHNSYDHTALISITEEGYESDYWLCLHDTCEAGKNFYNNLLKHPKSMFSAILEEGWLNMGLFSKEFISNNKNYILSLKNCNKMQAILSEQMYSRMGDPSFINSRARTQLKGKTDIYNDGIERLIIYFADLDLYKYQSFHYNSESTRLLKEKYLLDIHKLT
jgi:hypothetical protein